MPSVPLIYALSASHEIERAGSYAGLAAIIGLAVLTLLYISQAREVRRLKDWAGRGPERAAELEERVRLDAQKRVVATPIAAQTAAGQAAAARAVPAPPATAAPVVPAASPGAVPAATPGPAVPAGTPGTVLPAAATGAPTRIVPAKAPAAAAPDGIAAPADAPSDQKAPDDVTAPDEEKAESTAPEVPATPEPVVPGPVTPGTVPAAAGTTTGLGAGNGAKGPPVPGYLGPEPSRAQRSAPTLSPREAVEAHAQRTQRGGGLSRRSIAAVGGVLAIIVAIVIVATSGGGDDGTPANRIGAAPAVETPDEPATREPGTTAVPLDRASVKVAVLNGTRQTGLARSVADEIQSKGFTVGTVDDAVDQTQTVTAIAYTSGSRRAAQLVARIVGVDSDTVRTMDRDTAVAGGDADVVVTVAADRVG